MNPAVEAFVQHIAARSPTVQATLEYFNSPEGPDLVITHTKAGNDIGGAKAVGLFEGGITPDYTGREQQIRPGMTLQEIETLAEWCLTGVSRITIDQSLTVSTTDKNAIRTFVHEMGHANHAVQNPADYKHKSEQVRDAKGKVIDHDKRPVERIANEYRDRAEKEIKP